MAVTVTFYNNYKEALFNGTAPDLDTDTIKLALLDNTYTLDIDTHDFWDDISGDEVSGTGYTAGGATVAGLTVTQDDSNDKGKVDGTDVTWSTTSLTNVRYGILYKDTGTPATSTLICCINFGADNSPTAVDFVVSWHADGIATIA